MSITRSPEWRRLISEKAKKRWANPEFKKKVSDKIASSMKDPKISAAIKKARTGIRLSEITKQKLREARAKQIFTPEMIQKRAESLRGKKRTLETRKKMSEAQKGEKNYNWQGGKTELNKTIRKSFEYRLWRSDVFTRDNYTCRDCGVKGGILEAHHIKPYAQIVKEYNIKTLEEALKCEELWNINNGLTLCEECHSKTTNYKR